jgi:hypothetical protein
MRFRGGEFSTGTTGNFQPELTLGKESPAGGTAAAEEKPPRGEPRETQCEVVRREIQRK